MNKDTSWGGVADWYDSLIKGESSYQKDLILPNLLRLLEIKKNETILDLACGQGFFSGEFAAKGAKVFGADISKELIALAKKNVPKADFFVAQSEKLEFLKNESVDKVISVLAIQNIQDVAVTLKEVARVLRNPGKLYLVLNHPAFRIPKESSWEFDEKKDVQYRRIERYLSELKNKIQMHPGDKPSEYTLSFHRPLQYYFKALKKAGFLVSGLEEWSSHKKSVGKRAVAENRARAEFPLFLYLEAVKF